MKGFKDSISPLSMKFVLFWQKYLTAENGFENPVSGRKGVVPLADSFSTAESAEEKKLVFFPDEFAELVKVRRGRVRSNEENSFRVLFEPKGSIKRRLRAPDEPEGVVKAGGIIRFRLPFDHEVVDKDGYYTLVKLCAAPRPLRLKSSWSSSSGDPVVVSLFGSGLSGSGGHEN